MLHPTDRGEGGGRLRREAESPSSHQEDDTWHDAWHDTWCDTWPPLPSMNETEAPVWGVQ